MSDSQWRDIETAPKDGRAILVCVRKAISHGGLSWPDHADKGRRVTIAAWKDRYLGDEACWRALDSDSEHSYGGDTHSFDYVESKVIEPTHWMPLPEPPSKSA